MPAPILRINGHDYTEYVEELKLSCNGLNADGSGRDVQTGEMFRTKIADKQKWEVKMLRLPERVFRQLSSDLKATFYAATILDPDTGTQAAKTFYTDTIPYGVQRYHRKSGAVYYDGMSFNMTER